jgi:two-component system, OmpR family, response regulator
MRRARRLAIERWNNDPVNGAIGFHANRIGPGSVRHSRKDGDNHGQDSEPGQNNALHGGYSYFIAEKVLRKGSLAGFSDAGLKRISKDVQVGFSFFLHLHLVTSGPMRVLLVEDEPHLGSAVQEHVRAAGHAVDWFERLEPAEHAVLTVSYDALLLDLHLPDGRGLDFLRKLRRRGDALPVVILTARDLVSDRIEGLKAGADDYIVKPFDLDEVNARLEAVSRRYFGKAVPVLQVGPVELEWESKVARLDGRPVELSAREWAVIEVLGRRPHSTVSKEQIEDALYAFGDEIESNTIEVYVSRIRRKLGRDFIRTIRGLGYRLGD